MHPQTGGFLMPSGDDTELEHSQREPESAHEAQLRMKDEFLSRVSHELRSPLNAVYQYVTILLDGLAGEINEEQREYLGIALRNVKQLQAMIGDLLDVTRSESGKMVMAPQEMSLAESIATALDTERPEAHAKGLTLSSQVEEGLPAAYADPQRVQQIIVNLINNAIKFSPAGSTIRVSARRSAQLPQGAGPLSTTGGAEGLGTSWLEIAVDDSGCGIAAEDCERVFQRLYQVGRHIDQKRMGLGLGLYICRDLVSRLGGRIWVESRVGEGSTFRFTVPAYIPEQAVLSFLRARLTQAKEDGEVFSAVVVDADAAFDAVRPVWEALLPAAREKGFTAAAYAGSRFVVLADAGESLATCVRDHLRRLAKDACFRVAPDLCRTLSYGISVARPDADTADDVLARAAAAAVSERSLLAQKRLMVVDDDEQCLRLFRRFLTALGVASVRTAENGAQLFAALREEQPDLIVLDIQMPGMNGHEIIGRLKESAATAVIPIVVVTGLVGEHDGIEGETPGTAIPVLSKMNMAEVQRWVQHLL